MAVTARMSRKWMARMLIVGGAFLAFAGWCVYDGMVRYPEYNVMVAEYNRIAVEGKQLEQWEKLALERGWPLHFEGAETHADGTVRLHTAWDIRTQFIMAVLCLLVAVPVLLRVLLVRSRSMSVDDEGFAAVDGTRIPYAAIREIDRSKWQRKSIAVITYEKGGVRGRTKIDDWIFEGGEALLLQIEERTGLGAGAQTASAQPPAESEAGGDAGDRERE